MTDILRKKLRPLFEHIVEKLLDGAVDKVIADITARIETAFEWTTPTKRAAKSSTAKPVKPPPKPAKRTKAKPPAAKVVHRDVKPEKPAPAVSEQASPSAVGTKRPPRRCAICRELGKRSDGCGKTHNIGGANTPLPVMRAPALTAKQADIIARIMGTPSP